MPASAKSEVELPALRHESGSPRVLAADDQEHILEALELLLRPQGYKVDKVRSPALVREALASNSYDAVLIDLNYTRILPRARRVSTCSRRSSRSMPPSQ